jgi:hypothetical protein
VPLRARIVLSLADGADNKVSQRASVSATDGVEVAARLSSLDSTVSGCARGLERRATIDDARVDAVIAKTLESVPAVHALDTRSMAREAGFVADGRSRASGAHSVCSRIGKETFKLSERSAVRRKCANHRRPVPDPR